MGSVPTDTAFSRSERHLQRVVCTVPFSLIVVHMCSARGAVVGGWLHSQLLRRLDGDSLHHVQHHARHRWVLAKRKKALHCVGHTWRCIHSIQCPKIAILPGCRSGKFGPQKDGELGNYGRKCGMNWIYVENYGGYFSELWLWWWCLTVINVISSAEIEVPNQKWYWKSEVRVENCSPFGCHFPTDRPVVELCPSVYRDVFRWMGGATVFEKFEWSHMLKGRCYVFVKDTRPFPKVCCNPCHCMVMFQKVMLSSIPMYRQTTIVFTPLPGSKDIHNIFWILRHGIVLTIGNSLVLTHCSGSIGCL